MKNILRDSSLLNKVNKMYVKNYETEALQKI